MYKAQTYYIICLTFSLITIAHLDDEKIFLTFRMKDRTIYDLNLFQSVTFDSSTLVQNFYRAEKKKRKAESMEFMGPSG